MKKSLSYCTNIWETLAWTQIQRKLVQTVFWIAEINNGESSTEATDDEESNYNQTAAEMWILIQRSFAQDYEHVTCYYPERWANKLHLVMVMTDGKQLETAGQPKTGERNS